MPDPVDPCPPERPSAGFTRIPKPTAPGPRRDCDACVHRILDPRFGLRARRLPLRHADVLLDDAAVEERVALCDECHRRFEAQDARITAAVDRARQGLARREPLPTDALYALLDTVLVQDLLPRPAPARRPRSLAQKRQARAGAGPLVLQPPAAPVEQRGRPSAPVNFEEPAHWRNAKRPGQETINRILTLLPAELAAPTRGHTRSAHAIGMERWTLWNALAYLGTSLSNLWHMVDVAPGRDPGPAVDFLRQAALLRGFAVGPDQPPTTH